MTARKIYPLAPAALSVYAEGAVDAAAAAGLPLTALHFRLIARYAIGLGLHGEELAEVIGAASALLLERAQVPIGRGTLH